MAKFCKLELSEGLRSGVQKILRPPGQKNEGPSAGPFETPASLLGPKGALAPLKSW